MPTDQHHSPQAQTGSRFVACWHAIRQSYRYANNATHHVLGALLKLAVVAYFIFCALFLTLRYAVLPHVDNYRGKIEQIASDAIGRPVSIAAIAASWHGLRPSLSLTDVVVHDRDGGSALHLPSVSATVSWWSVVSADLRLYTLEIDRPDMEIQRDANGNLFVAGLLIDLHQQSDGKGADWVLSQREITIKDGRLHWIDHLRGTPELMLSDVNMVLRNDWQRHQFALKATPPAAISAPIDVRVNFRHPHFAQKMSDASKWTGELYADLRDTDLAAWKTYVDYPFRLEQGRGSVRAWLAFDHARVADFTADLTLSNVSARLREDLQPLELAQVNGRVSVRESLDPNVQDGTPTFGMLGHTISLVDFSMQTTDGLVLPKTTISERYVAAKRGKPERTEINAKLLDLRTLANFVERLPLPPAQLQMLSDFSPRGQLKDFSAQWEGAYPDIASYSVKGQFVGLSMKAQPARAGRPKTAEAPAQAAVPAIPGFENLTGTIDANDKGGAFSLASDHLRLTLPGYFADPEMPFDLLEMRAKWAFQKNDQLLLEVRDMNFVQQGLVASFSGKHLMPLASQPGKSLGTIDISGHLTGLDLKKVGSYLPLQTPEHLRAWLTGALEGGTLRDARVSLKGDLTKFPFQAAHPNDKPQGEFVVAGKIDDGILNYAPGHFGKDGKAPEWPLLEQINGNILFDRARMEIDADSAKTHGVALSNVTAVIPDLLHADSMLEIDGSAAGALQDFVRYTVDSPVAGWIGHFTDETRASGNARLALKLQLPLERMIDAKVQGTLQFANNNVTLQNAIPPLTSANGKLEFNEKGLNLNGVRANFLGGPVAVAGGTQRDGSILIKAEGSMTSDGIRKTYPAMQQAAQRIAGSTRYSALIGVKNKRPEIVVESTLQGLALNFPSPLRKAANDRMPLKFELASAPSDTASTQRDEIKLSLGSAIAASYLREKQSGEAGASWRVLRGGIGINVPAPEPDSGVTANVSLKSLSIDEWRDVTASITATDAEKETDDSPDSLGIAQYIEPGVLAARATELYVMGKKLDNVVVGASHEKNVWQVNIDSRQASGYLTWNESRSGRGLGKVTARLASLTIPKSAATEVTDLLEGKNATTEIPALDIVAENFELFGKKFGHLELTANNVRADGSREWRIRNLSIVNPDAEFKATGKWSTTDGDSVSSLAYTLNVADAGRLLDRFGFANVLRGGKGKMNGDISWKGLPFSLDIPTLSGQVNLNMAAGQFLKVEPGAAKLLGVLSLQSLPRRLALDFRDVFSEGFAFDGVTATANIANGIAATDNFKMRSVNATVLIDGSADIARESQDLRVVVLPEINVGAASVVYALAVNPVIGIGSFLAQLFLREPLMRAFTFEYTITGGWKDPTVTKVERKLDTPATSGEPASKSNKTTNKAG